MTPLPVFTLDVAACSGCKACQIACRDRHGLPAGVQWRRVYEVSGGGWRQQDGAWQSDVFAWNLSLSCNHCERPACVDACPTGAMVRRPDGVVLVDGERCAGCGYCAWACPYDAPQFDERSGTMGKCTLCIEDVERGLDPACVAACPLRVLDFVRAEPPTSYAPPAIPPLPSPQLTAPRLHIRAPAAAARANGAARIANREELPRPRGRGEASLVAFTLLAQAAAGLALAIAVAQATALVDASALVGPARAVAALALAALLVSLLHLGRPRNAWRTLANLRHSPLSREILLTAAFTVAALALVLAERVTGTLPPLLTGAAALLGAGAVWAMSAVYRLPTIPQWNTARTTASFFAAAALLGVALLSALIVPQWTPLLALIALVALLDRVRFYHRFSGRSL